MSIEDSKEKTFQQGLFVGHGHSNSFDRMIALEPFRRSASGRNKLPTLPTYLPKEIFFVIQKGLLKGSSAPISNTHETLTIER